MLRPQRILLDSSLCILGDIVLSIILDYSTMTTFNDRKMALFDSLVTAESQIPHKMLPPLQNTVIRNHNSSGRSLRRETKPYKGRQSMFSKHDDSADKRIQANRSGVRRNPNKWTYYNMEDVPEVSERSNAAAAAACMNEIQISRRISDPDSDAMDSSDSKIVFRLPIKQTSYKDDLEEAKIKQEDKIFIKSKIILPEYVVGEKKKSTKPKTIKSKASSSKSNLKLDHLLEEEDDE